MHCPQYPRFVSSLVLMNLPDMKPEDLLPAPFLLHAEASEIHWRLGRLLETLEQTPSGQGMPVTVQRKGNRPFCQACGVRTRPPPPLKSLAAGYQRGECRART